MIRMLMYIGLTWLLTLAVTLSYLFIHSYMLFDRETERQVRLWHEQTAGRMERDVEELDRMIKSLSSDYAVRRYVENGMQGENGEDEMMKDYVEGLIRQQVQQLPYVNELCLMRSMTGVSVCNKPSASSKPLAGRSFPSMNRNDRLLFAPLQEENEGPHADGELIYAAPLLDRNTNVVQGMLSLSLNANVLFKDAIPEERAISTVVYDEHGNLIFKLSSKGVKPGALGMRSSDVDTDEAALWEKGQFRISKRLGIPQTSWMLSMESPSLNPLLEGKSVWISVLISVLMVSFVIGLGIFLTKRYYFAPIGNLRALMKRAELGDLKAYWVGRSSDEFEALGESYNQMLNRLEELIRQVKREEALKKEAEMEALQYQLNPHFLYNTLNTIKWVAKLHQTPQIAEAVTALVRLLQASLGKKGDFIEVREEIGLLRDYMEIQRFRYGDKIALNCEVEPAVSNCLLPCMLLQPLVENAIVHGIEPAKKDGIITVRVGLDEARQLLVCEVEDNGVGMSSEQIEARPASGGQMREKMSGIGLRHIRDKIRLYYGNGYNMHMVSKPGEGTRIRLTLPVHVSGGYPA